MTQTYRFQIQKDVAVSLHLLGPKALPGDALAQPISESKGQNYIRHTYAFHAVLQEQSRAPISPSTCTCNSPPGASISLPNKHKSCSGGHSTNSSEDPLHKKLVPVPGVWPISFHPDLKRSILNQFERKYFEKKRTYTKSEFHSSWKATAIVNA